MKYSIGSMVKQRNKIGNVHRNTGCIGKKFTIMYIRAFHMPFKYKYFIAIIYKHELSHVTKTEFNTDEIHSIHFFF